MSTARLYLQARNAGLGTAAAWLAATADAEGMWAIEAAHPWLMGTLYAVAFIVAIFLPAVLP